MMEAIGNESYDITSSAQSDYEEICSFFFFFFLLGSINGKN